MLKNNRGFTLLEALLVLLIFLSVAALFPMLFREIDQVNQQLQPERKAEWELFVVQLRRELGFSTDWSATEGKLTFSHETENVMIEKYQQHLRRRVNGTGHELILLNIQSVRFFWEGKVLIMQAEFMNGEKEEASFLPM
ncbi:competence protein ComGF [Bacillus ectoiniformans]|uniref:competence type IV pilus minor pilin ComGF n=1 Tax=Bacillus ectoiniformans TaxID=1494429 RepID=UPI0019572051|nr:competence protein ComGF [Bacillus ectoiniformans]